jgi:rhodanese-related sulfurtransferase
MVHCKSGHRSERAVKIMRNKGFTHIIHMDGGYDAWKALAPPAG